jgi:perosamine synthetase
LEKTGRVLRSRTAARKRVDPTSRYRRRHGGNGLLGLCLPHARKLSASPRNPLDEFRRAIGELVGVPPGHVTLFWKGRVALYAILRALGVGQGDEVVVPAFTCVAVPNAILYTGASPVYVDIDEATYTPDPEAVAAAVGPRTRVILAQNTFGLSSDIEALSNVAAQNGVAVVDDCAHGLGGRYRGLPTGVSADAAFYSTQWTKPISTGLGGIAVTRDPQLARELRALEEAAREPSSREKALLRALVFARDRLAGPRTIQAGRTVYRTLGRLGVLPASSSGQELDAPVMPADFFCRMSSLQASRGERALQALPDVVVRRRAVAAFYSEWLAAHGCAPAHEPPSSVHAFLRYPLRVRGRDAFRRRASSRGVSLGDWFDSPLHPIEGDLTPWGYRRGGYPVAERITAEIVNLPTDVARDGPQLRAVEKLLEESVDHIR